MLYPATTSTPHPLPPDRLRERAVQRRASVSAEVARLISELAFGHLDRDRVLVVPVLLAEVR